ncbi:MAG: YegS/Rv2252/BmrU family lipid kinase [Ruminococcus sp.]|nr:YegS/Rv2252/BmrU family lipid kinase [Ruminococcus sp.]
MKKLYFIFNLQAGKGNLAGSLAEVIDIFTKAGFEVTARPTQERTDAVNASIYACENSFDMIVCAGGDGTLSECIEGVMRAPNKLPIGYIPVGSTNDYAKGLGIPKGILPAAKWIVEGMPMPCDIGSFNNNYFTYIAAFGAFTNVAYETSQQIKNLFGHAAYLFSGMFQLTSIKSHKMRVEYDGNIIEDDFVFGMVTNSSSVAGLLSLNDFLVDDGLFEVALIKKPTNVIQLYEILHSLLNMTKDLDKEYIKSFRTSEIKFTSLEDAPITWTLDGENGGKSDVNIIKNNSKAISFMIGPQAESNFSNI